MKDLRAAIIGIGAIADMLALCLQELDGITLVAGSCRRENKGREFAARWDCRWYADYEELLRHESPDVVLVSTPSGAHREPALAALAAGAHVLCEKPLEISVQRGRDMIAAARRQGRLLGGVFPMRYFPVMQPIHAAARGGRFGELSAVAVQVPWWREDKYYAPDRWQGTLQWDGGGAFINQAIHNIDIMQWLVAASAPPRDPGENPVQTVCAFTGTLGHDPSLIEVEDTAAGILQFRNGTLGQVLATTSLWPGSLSLLLMGGRDGTVEVREEQMLTFKFRDEQPQDDEVRQRLGAPTAAGGGAADPMDFHHHNHKALIADFLAAVRGDKEFPIPGEEALKAVAIVEALYRSAATGQVVEVESVDD